MGVRLGNAPMELEKVELPMGVTCWCAPANTVIWEAARSYSEQLMRSALEGSEVLEEVGIDVSMLPALADPHVAEGFRRLLFVQSLAGTVIKRWTGVEYQEGEGGPWLPAPATRLQINQLMMIHAMADAFIDRYSRKYSVRFSEGNGSGLSSNGTPAGEPTIATVAATSERLVQQDAAGRIADAVLT